MKKFAVVAIEILLGLLALVQVLRIIGQDFSDRIVGAIILFLCVAAIIAIHRWAKRK